MNKYQRAKILQDACVSDIQMKSTEELQDIRQFLHSLKHFRKLKKLNDTFIQGPLKAVEYNEAPVIHSDFNLDGTVTGRMSCSTYYGNNNKPMGVSFHTLPKKDTKTEVNVRKAYIAPEGYAFIAADYATMELRVLADIADVSEMKRAFIEEKDLHTYAASLTFNKPEEEIDKNTERSPAKVTSFLTVYGGGAANLANSMGIPLKRAEFIIKRYLEVFHEIPVFMDQVRQEVIANQEVTTIFGRKRRLPDIMSSDKSVQERAFRQGLNFLIQSPASDVMECAALGAYQDINKYKLDARIVAVVHDSLEVICKKNQVEDMISIIYDNMVENRIMKSLGVDFSVPLKIDVDVGNSFGDGKEVEMTESTCHNLDKVMESVK